MAFTQSEIAVVGRDFGQTAANDDFGFAAATNIDAIEPIVLKQKGRGWCVYFKPIERAVQTACLYDGDTGGHLELRRPVRQLRYRQGSLFREPNKRASRKLQFRSRACTGIDLVAG
jgi:hypothetical protein